MARQPLVGQGLLMIEASRSHSDTPHSVGLLWTSDQPDTETSICTSTHNTHNRVISMPPAGIRTRIPASKRPQTPRLRPRDQWDRQVINNTHLYVSALKVCYSHLFYFNRIYFRTLSVTHAVGNLRGRRKVEPHEKSLKM